jgi:hypothetical protein
LFLCFDKKSTVTKQNHVAEEVSFKGMVLFLMETMKGKFKKLFTFYRLFFAEG